MEYSRVYHGYSISCAENIARDCPQSVSGWMIRTRVLRDHEVLVVVRVPDGQLRAML
jgi:hypothetical protein